MDVAERLIATFRGRPSAPVRAKVDTLLELEFVVHPRVVSFFLEVLADREEPIPVRIYVLRHIRNKQLGHGFRAAVAEAMLRILTDRSVPHLRLQAALALAGFTDVEGCWPRSVAWRPTPRSRSISAIQHSPRSS